MKCFCSWAGGFVCWVLILCSCRTVQPQPKYPGTDSVRKAAGPAGYRTIITDKAKTSAGLFKVHHVNARYYFEIPDSLFGREILTVNRLVKAAAEGRIDAWGTAGDMLGSNVVKFVRGPENKVFINRISYNERSADSSENGLYRSVVNSTMLPIIASFDVKAFSGDSTSVVIDVTDYLNADNSDVFFFNPMFKKRLSFLGAYQPDKSYIKEIKAFPLNVEIRTVKTYIKDNYSPLSFTYELNSSVVLLPKVPMQPRMADLRVGYFRESYRDFDDPMGVGVTDLITRWRLEPAPRDVEDYKRGILVKPQKPIVYYIDPATPAKWIPYLKQGVLDWQQAFEKAGFKEAIYALEAPVGDSSWSLEDARHNAIIYKASYVENASGPHIHDPRSGEILETHINWYHNVVKLLQSWYFVQASPNDPAARSIPFNDTLMGKLIRFVCAHEVGHTLGLLHNFGASSTVSVELLRNKKWVEENGFCPSIMDYARFNYVAQPEDKIGPAGILPRIGAYDEWAIEWGYRWLPDLKSREAEKRFMNKWIIARTGADKRLWFGDEGSIFDPRRQSEDLGDDAMKAGAYGIANLKRIMPNLYQWAGKPNEGYGTVNSLHNSIRSQYEKYLFHVARNIGGITANSRTIDEPGAVIAFVSRAKQKQAVYFLKTQLFEPPVWLINKAIFEKVAGKGLYAIIDIQQRVLKMVLSQQTLTSLLWFESNEGTDKAYTIHELLTDLEAGIWNELEAGKTIDIYRRNLQKVYVERLLMVLDYKKSDEVTDVSSIGPLNARTDVPSVAKAHIKELQKRIGKALHNYTQGIARWHLLDVQESLQRALEPGRPAADNRSAKQE
ncbi:zinc-dependent metalloprotease [Filimonas effusa]|uniref:DUF5117 domain-containing protein n=1 Tax=Filimonas effusa TaxID=2508721 RepID=A0A4Q1D1R5_9BACT|nr:zinc-dependent metalloprotease [Filimonas effusa]RXK81761.1 DUF5117 domain-containing protein [Filimonas effusa]